MPDLETLAAARLADWRASWSMGSWGAVAEFHQDDGEPAVADGLERVTSRGAIRLQGLADAEPLAYETVSPDPRRWTVAVALCLPAEAARRDGRGVLTELGPDDDAVRPGDRAGILFDLGLGQPQVDFCIRVTDPALLATLRGAAGRPVLAPGNPALGAIVAAHPHRVALTNLGRIEVFQKIGGPETGGVSPAGPHTHVLPKLLASGRTHSANVPIPHGLVPCAGLHPGNPVIGAMGEDRAFDAGLHAAFEALLEAWGDPDYVVAKRAVRSALDAGREPGGFEPLPSRSGRAGLRNALRQRRRERGGSDLLDRWSATFDRGGEPAEPDRPGH
ncbi:MAG TPA: hypothetical protein PKA33_18920 [Amaricoccus sp.]|uniref:DUF6925 family protein n=1 Tax=Amaricoccus sp. TaxID=1872485 RepID=UPI002CDB8336|nr:hypothetical protein [Amaricoccus sp.]HMQ94686.1 hypothetical protein [Amaricoccus sp.]HMR54393.1 hypothetical protein [Amaricoccus sp.]HMR61873.1 hypothetical protein [Amaricoccus sp.]HMU01415.1 hypothetical protein [Amaricoccus sp.]